MNANVNAPLKTVHQIDSHTHTVHLRWQERKVTRRMNQIQSIRLSLKKVEGNMIETWPFLAHLISSFSWPERGAQEAERRGIRCLALLARRRFRKLSKTILQPLSLPIEFETRYEHDRPTS